MKTFEDRWRRTLSLASALFVVMAASAGVASAALKIASMPCVIKKLALKNISGSVNGPTFSLTMLCPNRYAADRIVGIATERLRALYVFPSSQK